MRPYTNRLIHESSPYLLQHAHNPVDWYPWGEEAFEKAKNEDKPVLVSIGYAACHWCHVMERESFEDPGVAAIMNEKFVNIKVDREERPDVDHIYMDAVQAISGSGGWPLNVFLTPDKKPFFGGTYFPPVKAFNRSSWTDVLMSIDKSYRERKSEIERQAENLTAHLKSSNAFGPMPVEKNTFHISQIDQAFRTVMDTADLRWGGFGRAPKFPQTFTIHFLLQYADVRKNTEALNQVVLSLDKMLQGGIYDQIGGGFARYSTDAEWLAPHFEKMLYDNALLIAVLAESFQFTGRDIYKKAMEESLAFIERELMHEGGGFYSALDADSEGKEGKFYVWTVDEIKEILQDDAVVVCDYFDISAEGNWEGENIPRIQKSLPAFASERKMDLAEAEKLIEKAKQKLLQKRSERIHPQLDDKIILGWNALMNIAYSKAYAATANEHYREVAVRNMQFLLNNFKTESDLLLHVWKNDRAKHPAFLDDYSYLIAALIELTQITADYQYLEAASKLTQTVIDHFSDEHDSFFFFTHREQKDILVRKKETYDGATPSGNSMMAYNLYRLSILLDKQEWRERSELMVSSLAELIIKYPTSFGLWLALLFEIISGTSEIAVVGKKWKIYLEKVHGIYISHKLALASENPLPRYPLLADKNETSEILIYLCKNYACRQPVNTIQEFVSLLESK